MNIEGLTRWHVIIFITWTYVLIATISSNSAHSLNHSFGISIVQTALNGIKGISNSSKQITANLDKQINQSRLEPTSPAQICYGTPDGSIECNE